MNQKEIKVKICKHVVMPPSSEFIFSDKDKQLIIEVTNYESNKLFEITPNLYIDLNKIAKIKLTKLLDLNEKQLAYLAKQEKTNRTLFIYCIMDEDLINMNSTISIELNYNYVYRLIIKGYEFK